MVFVIKNLFSMFLGCKHLVIRYVEPLNRDKQRRSRTVRNSTLINLSQRSSTIVFLLVIILDCGNCVLQLPVYSIYKVAQFMPNVG